MLQYVVVCRALLAAVLATLLLAAGCGGDDDSETTPEPPPVVDEQGAEVPEADRGSDQDDTDNEEPGEGADQSDDEDSGPTRSADERAVARAVRAYVGALDRGDGEALCSRLVPDAINEVELPRGRGGCAPSLSASIGYRDPRGIPVWKSGRVSELARIDVEGDSARVVATVVTQFADREEPSIEDDIVYLERRGEEWLIVKPSSTLYRAVAIPDVPPSVLAPPE